MLKIAVCKLNDTLNKAAKHLSKVVSIPGAL